MSLPADSELVFWGFLDDTDEEIRTELSDGAGYQNPYWWDDFQNYLTEAAGNPYDYIFSNLISGEFYHLEGLIPDSSYQEENIILTSASNPSKPIGMKATVASTSRVMVSWNKVAGMTYHVYRRYTSSNGSLFRLDDPSGSLANPGVSDSFFADTTVDGASSYTYMVIGEDSSGKYTPHSDEVSCPPVGVPYDGQGAKLPQVFSLSQNYPNPFNPITQIKYALPRDCQVRFDVYSILGKRVTTLVDGQQKAGYKTIRWDANSFAGGIYFCRLKAGDFVETRKMILLR